MPQPVRRPAVKAKAKARPTTTRRSTSTAEKLRNLTKPRAGNTALSRRVAAVEKQIKSNVREAEHVSTAHTQWLDARQRAILSADPSDAELAVRPEGHVYMPHVFVRNRLDKVLGEGCYFIIETGPPAKQGNEVVQAWRMDVPGIGTVASATGKAMYHATNAAMGWGDAVEACKSRAIMRIGKALSIGKILWAPQFQQQYRAEHCVVVECEKHGRQGTKIEFYVRHKDRDFLDGERRVVGPADRENMRKVRRRQTDDVIDSEPASPPQSRSGQSASGQTGTPPAGSAPRQAPPRPAGGGTTASAAMAATDMRPPQQAATPQVFVSVDFIKADPGPPAYRLWRAVTRYDIGQGRHHTAEYAVFSDTIAEALRLLVVNETPCEVTWQTSRESGKHKITEVLPLTPPAK